MILNEFHMISSLQKAENNAVLPERFFKVTLGSLDAGALAVLPNKNCQNLVTILLEPLNVTTNNTIYKTFCSKILQEKKSSILLISTSEPTLLGSSK